MSYGPRNFGLRPALETPAAPRTFQAFAMATAALCAATGAFALYWAIRWLFG
jgi:hypothetical protein